MLFDGKTRNLSKVFFWGVLINTLLLFAHNYSVKLDANAEHDKIQMKDMSALTSSGIIAGSDVVPISIPSENRVIGAGVGRRKIQAPSLSSMGSGFATNTTNMPFNNTFSTPQ